MIGSQYFLYDTNGRLTKASVERPTPNGQTIATQVHQFTYDEFGNMTSGPDSTTLLPTSTATNHLTGLGAVYDDAGNLTRWTPTGETVQYGYAFDALGALTDVKVNDAIAQVHVYTADDERIWTYDFSTATSHWKIRDLGGKVLRDYFDSGAATNRWTVHRDYFYRDGQLLAAITPTGTIHFSLDHLGTPRVITNAAATAVGFHHYFPFGKEWKLPGDLDEGEVMKFTGHERDKDPAGRGYDSEYMHARYYSSYTARFFATDPVVGIASLPETWNRYSYTANQPIHAVDPDGETTFLVIGHPRVAREFPYINPFGHAAIAINDVVFSYGTNWTKNSDLNVLDWGQSLAAYLDNQEGKRSSSLLEFVITDSQEKALLRYLLANNPNAAGQPRYNAFNPFELETTCVSVLLAALMEANLVPQKYINRPQTPVELLVELLNSGLVRFVESVTVRGSYATTGNSPRSWENRYYWPIIGVDPAANLYCVNGHCQ